MAALADLSAAAHMTAGAAIVHVARGRYAGTIAHDHPGILALAEGVCAILARPADYAAAAAILLVVAGPHAVRSIRALAAQRVGGAGRSAFVGVTATLPALAGHTRSI